MKSNITAGFRTQLRRLPNVYRFMHFERTGFGKSHHYTLQYNLNDSDNPRIRGQFELVSVGEQSDSGRKIE